MDIKELIIFEDKNIIVINKPINLLSQKDGSEEPSLEDYLFEYLKPIKPQLINRLDKDTSGLVCFGKNELATRYFNEVFSNHELVKKTYLTLVSGIVSENGEIDAPIRKNFQKHKMVIAPLSSGAKQAKTIFEPVKNFADSTLLKVSLLTGRTHQIRVHMSYIKHHVIGDYKYGDFKINNLYKKEYGVTSQLLHSYSLTFSNLKKEFSYLNDKEFIAPLSPLFESVISKLK